MFSVTRLADLGDVLSLQVLRQPCGTDMSGMPGTLGAIISLE